MYALFGKKQNIRHLHSNLNILKDIDGIEIPAFGCWKARKRYPSDNSLSWSQYWSPYSILSKSCFRQEMVIQP